jgi:hypothetical protein
MLTKSGSKCTMYTEVYSKVFSDLLKLHAEEENYAHIVEYIVV